MATRKEDVEKSTRVPVRGGGGGGIAPLREEMNRLFDRFTGFDWPWHRNRGLAANEALFGRDPFAGLEWPTPWGEDTSLGRADLSRTDEGYELQIDMPGMSRDNIEIELSDGILSISGQRSDEHEDKRKGYYLSERTYGSVRRSFRVPESVKTDEIKAQFQDGVLTLSMPSTEEAKRSTRKIDVE
jgi:HSP20 family protein